MPQSFFIPSNVISPSREGCPHPSTYMREWSDDSQDNMEASSHNFTNRPITARIPQMPATSLPFTLVITFLTSCMGFQFDEQLYHAHANHWQTKSKSHLNELATHQNLS